MTIPILSELGRAHLTPAGSARRTPARDGGEAVSETLFLCRACYPDGGGDAVVFWGPCSYCGAVCCTNPASEAMGKLPRGSLVDAEFAPPPRALSRQEREAQARPAPEPHVETPNPFKAVDGEPACGQFAGCGGVCSKRAGHQGDCACAPDPETGEETCPA